MRPCYFSLTTCEAEEIQKILVFEGAFEKIFSIIKEEGCLEGGVVVQGCLELLNNLIRNNASNQVLLRETMGFDPLISILKLRGSSYSFTQQKMINLLSALETIGLLIMGGPEIDTGKDANRLTNKAVLVQVVILSPARTATQQGSGKVRSWKINFLSTQKLVTMVATCEGRLRPRQTSSEVSLEGPSNLLPQDSVETTAVPTEGSQSLKRKRGPTKLKTIAVDGGSRIEILYNDLGQPIGDGSVKLSSFLGALVREIVPVTLLDWRKLPLGMEEVLWKSIQVRFKVDEEWQKDHIFMSMDDLWRASKSRLVTKIRKASNEEERLKLRPDNIKSIHEWKDFLKEKTSEKFKAKSEKFKAIRRKQLPHTCSRKGYARLTEDMKNKGATSSSLSRVPIWIQAHTKKSGEPINTTVAETIDKLKEVELDDPVSSSILKVKQDALSKILGRENRGRIRGLGKEVTLSKLCVLSQRDSFKTQEKEEATQLKERVAHLESVVTHLMRNEKQASEEGSTRPIVSPSNTNTPNKKCKLLDWMGSGEVVAEGRWSSSDPKQLVHHIPIGPNAMRVWVDLAREAGAYLWRPTADMTYIEDAVGTTVAWPADKVVMG